MGDPVDGTFWLYMFLNITFGVVGCWMQGGTNFPILSQIVPAEKRSRVLAVEGAMENSMANILAAQAVPFISRVFFGFDLDEIPSQEGINIDAARAIGYSVGVACCISWCISYVVYS